MFPPDFPPAPSHTRIKVCGLTCAEDAALAVELGVDALGFNFYPGSARYLSPAADLSWLHSVPAGVRRVAVVVNATTGLIADLLRERLVDSVQLHGDEEEDFCRELHRAGLPFTKAIRVRDAAALETPERFHTGTLLLDAYHPSAYGGTGHCLDWTLAGEFTSRQNSHGRRVILSGGLNPQNVAEAVQRVKPYAVDVASGVEQPGNARRKSEARLREFVLAVRSADAQIASGLAI